MGLKRKCLVCAGCTNQVIRDGRIFYHCWFCNLDFKLVPGNKLVQIESMEKELSNDT